MPLKPLSPTSAKAKLSYPETVLAFNDDHLIASLNEACQNLAKSSIRLMRGFDAISSQLNSFDAQTRKNKSPLRPVWSGIQKDFTDVVKQHRVSAGLISGRLKMLHGMILPMVTRNSEGESERSRNEKIHILKSYMNISSDHAAFTYTLTEKALGVTSRLNVFHTEYAKISCQGETTGQQELRELTHKLSDLEDTVKQLCSAFGRSSQPDGSALAFTVLKNLVSGSPRSTHRTLSCENVALSDSGATAIGVLYKQLDSAHDELAHANYSVQVTNRRTDSTSTTRASLTKLVSDELLNVQAGLSLFLATWGNLKTECMTILDWLENRKAYLKPPACVETYLATGCTLYPPLARALDAYISALDPGYGGDER